jgi:hypothetical protein
MNLSLFRKATSFGVEPNLEKHDLAINIAKCDRGSLEGIRLRCR